MDYGSELALDWKEIYPYPFLIKGYIAIVRWRGEDEPTDPQYHFCLIIVIIRLLTRKCY